MCAPIQACICVSVCACMYAFVTCVCMHLYIIIIMCSAHPEVAAVLDWYGPEADPAAYWQRGRKEVAGLQVVCEAHNVH